MTTNAVPPPLEGGGAGGGGWLRNHAQPHLFDIPGYVPIEPPEVLAARIGVDVDSIVKLDGNENPYGASPRALRALSVFEGYNIYPDPEQRRLRRALAKYAGVRPEQVIAGAGSDELIDLLTRMFVPQGGGVVNFPPTFGMYAFSAEVQGAEVINLPRNQDFALRLDGFAEASRGAGLVFVVSPNNPSGTPLSEEELGVLLATGLPVVVDEAYAEFAGESFLPLVSHHPNLIILRTLSKWAGLAGLRIGYMVASEDIVRLAMKMKQPYSINVAAELAAVESIADREWLMANVGRIVSEREHLARRLAALPGFHVFPSSSNFLLCRLAGHDAKGVRDGLAAKGIMVRYFDTPLLKNCIRISVGRPDQSDRLLRALEELVAREGKKEGAT